MPIARVGGTEIWYETHGAGFPLVFVHGGFGGLGTGLFLPPPPWVERFAREFRVILYDRRSSGRSGYPETPHTMRRLAADIRELLGHLGEARAHAWGTSAGGPITLAFGLEHPDAATSLVVADSAPWLSRDAELLGRLRERIRILETEGPDAAYAARREHGTVGLDLFARSRPARVATERASRDAQRDRIREQIASIPREERVRKYAGELRNYAAYLDHDVSPRFAELTMPVFIAYATGDTVFPEAGWAELAAGRPHVTYHAINGEHGAAGQDPATLDAILEFLRRATPPH